MTYLVIQCPCGKRLVRDVKDISKYRLKCVFCGKTTKLHDKRAGMLNLNIYGIGKDLNEHQAQAVLKEVVRYD